MNYWIFIIPVISAIIGWLINSAIISLLFRPRQPKKIAGNKLQGVIPRYKPMLAIKLGELAAREFTFEGIEKKISDPETVRKVMPLIEDHIDHFLKVKLPKEMPVISMFIGDKTIGSLKKTFLQEIEDMFPMVLSKFAGNLKEEFDPQKIIQSKIDGMDDQFVESILRKQLSKQFIVFRCIGAVTGFIIGLLQILLTLIVQHS
jgi:uncharacterized membrane protein YheB (UPF0754 family)